MPRISIILPTYNRLDLLQPCCESLIKYTDFTDKEVIVMSNGCKDGSVKYIQKLGDPFRIIHWPHALGYPRAVNIGVSVSDAEYVLLWNNDNLILDFAYPDWTDIMEAPFKNNPTTGISGLNIVYRGGWEWFPFFCVMIKRSLFTKIGFLDEAFSPGAGEDTDFCVRAGKAGYSMQQVFNMPLYHPSGSTMNSFPDKDEIYMRNERILYERYGAGTFEPTDTRV